MIGNKSIQDLLKGVESEEYKLPEFQRGYVWKSKQVKEYIDSLYRGYPTGSFLIWKTPQAHKVRSRDGAHNNSDNKFYQLILDGQQRLTSLYALFRGTPPPFYEGEELFFNLYFNLDTEEFRYYMQTIMKDKMEWIPVTDFFKHDGAARFIEKAPSSESKDYYIKNLSKLNKLDDIKKYTYYLEEVSELDIDEVVTIFNLVNSSGTPLSKADLGLAHICSFWPEARDIFKEAQAKFSKFHFDIELDFITMCISAIAVDSVLFERSFYEADKELIQKSWEKVEQILEYIINILRNDAYIDSLDDLATDYVLILILYYLSKNNNRFATEQDMKKLLYWMYAALMWGRYSGQPSIKLQADLVNIKNNNNIEMVIDGLKRWRGGRLEIEPEDLELQGSRSRFYPMTYIVARSKGATDWFDDMKLYSKNIGIRYSLENHHIFPQAVLYKSGYDSSNSTDKRTVNELANLAFLTKKSNLRISKTKPLKYLEEIEKRSPQALKRQFVPIKKELWDVKRFDDFLDARRKTIAKEINKYMEKLIGDVEILRPPTTMEIIKSGENEMMELKCGLRWNYKSNQVDKEIEYMIMRTIAAFQNYNGGILFIGVHDDGKIQGIEKDFESLGKSNSDGFQLHLTNLVESYIGKEFNKYIHPKFEELEGKTICKIMVEQSKQPVFVRHNGQKEFHVRTGNSTKAFDVEETTKYIKSHFDM